MDLRDLGFADTTPQEKKMEDQVRLDATLIIIERMNSGEISNAEAVDLVNDNRKRYGLLAVEIGG